MNFLEKCDFDWMELLNFYERPFRAKLIPSKIWRDLDKYENDSNGLVNYCKKWRTKVEFIPNKSKAKIFETYVAVGGEYGADERQCVIQIHTDKYDSHKFTIESWDKFKYRVIQTLMHEMIHFMQYDRRCDQWSNYVVPYKKVGHTKKDAERRYLSEFDEIQAYAHCIYLDFRMYKPRKTIEELINRSKKRRDSTTFHYFLKTFDYDFRNNEAIPKVIHQIGKWQRKYERVVSSRIK